MSLRQLAEAIRRVAADPTAPPPAVAAFGDTPELAEALLALIEKNRRLHTERHQLNDYIRAKIDQLLTVIGTQPLRPEDLTDDTLLALDPIGVVAGAFGQILDHQRETNRQLELAMDEIAAVFEAVGSGVLVVDEEMRVQAYNQHAKKLFPTFKGKWEGAPCHRIVCRDTRLGEQCPFRKVLDTGQVVHLEDWPVGDRHFDIVASPVKNKEGKVVNGVMLYHDITFQKRAAAELAAEKEQLAVTLRSIAEGVITTDIDGNVVLMNRVAEELTGWTQQEAAGQPSCDVFWVVNEKNRSTCIKLPRQVIATDRTVELGEDTVLIARDGVERLISAIAASIYDRDRETVGVVVVFRDITAEKQLEEEILNARRIESLGILAGGIAHDFNNLLTGIMGNITLARMTAGKDHPATEKLERAEKACLRARDLTQQLLTFSKGGAPVRKTASIADLLRETALFALRGSNVQCHIDIADNLWPVNVDEGQIGQVVNNLVINADQAMPRGGVVTLTADNFTVTESSRLPLASGRYIRVTVQDSGPGIKPEHLDKIFMPYYTTKKTGSGLGLASCYAIIKKHEGHLAVTSAPGQGATFTFYLVASADRPHREQPPTEVTTPRGTGRILVMDDEEMIRELAQELLTDAGFEVTLTADGTAAVAAYAQAFEEGNPFDVVLMDLTIPGGMGGKEALRQLLAIDPRVKAIVSSGYSMDAAMADFATHGFMAVVPKPYRAETLLAIVQQVLAGNSGPRPAS